MALRAGLNDKIMPTLSMALVYETTPLEIAAAYTIFANQGTWVKPTTIAVFRGWRDGVNTSPRPRRSTPERLHYAEHDAGSAT
jgi:membrane carboxypeptidase/penicillin-binding protein